uniref:RING-type domain-containing protein n=1 Tax=Glossina brevipalpis TaxID=37001 RepID=A0A1A9WSN3_9MUSC
MLTLKLKPNVSGSSLPFPSLQHLRPCHNCRGHKLSKLSCYLPLTIVICSAINVVLEFLMNFYYSLNLHSIRRLLEHDTSGAICPTCRISFDKGKRRKLIDTCGHERCYSCMFRNDQCPMCIKVANHLTNERSTDVDGNNAQGYDTGIGGSTSTIVSPLGSPQPQLRSQVQRTNANALARYMQCRKTT